LNIVPSGKSKLSQRAPLRPENQIPCRSNPVLNIFSAEIGAPVNQLTTRRAQLARMATTVIDIQYGDTLAPHSPSINSRLASAISSTDAKNSRCTGATRVPRHVRARNLRQTLQFPAWTS